MKMFNVGDRVIRVRGGDDSFMKRGETYIVASCNTNGIFLEGSANCYTANYFDLAPSNKATNPKDAIGDTKLDYSTIPSSVLAYLATAFFEGAVKYGKLNWRHCGVRGSVYTNALTRHLNKYISGEFADPETGVPHLASVMACAGIILDAGLHNKLTDDRPDDSKESLELISECADIQQSLKVLHKDKSPLHYTRDRNTNGTN